LLIKIAWHDSKQIPIFFSYFPDSLWSDLTRSYTLIVAFSFILWEGCPECFSLCECHQSLKHWNHSEACIQISASFVKAVLIITQVLVLVFSSFAQYYIHMHCSLPLTSEMWHTTQMLLFMYDDCVWLNGCIEVIEWLHWGLAEWGHAGPCLDTATYTLFTVGLRE
jgi:hypothetical protein